MVRQWGNLVAVADLTLTVQTGECYAFLGRNGSGKSTTARLLLDFIRPTRGRSRAVMSDPELLILDEPTSGLDPVLQEEFRDLLAERKRASATIWMSSHVMAEAERVADRVGLIDEGRLALELSMDELRRKTAGQLVQPACRRAARAMLISSGRTCRTSALDRSRRAA
jgi:ABC-type multidrug transport system ATPase subunit